MREIRFRGKRVDNGEFVYGFVAITDNYPFDGTKKSAYIWKIPCVENCIPVIPELVGQYTGLKDKNGKEVYEGDILHIYEYYCEEEPELNEWKDRVVEWDECGQCLSIEWDYGEYDVTAIGWAFEYFDNSDIKVEVIGTIHDNPSLLEVQP